MGNRGEHVGLGVFYSVTGLWQLFNHIKLYALHPESYTAPPWFKYLELFFTLAFCCLAIFDIFYIRPDRHEFLDPNGTIPFAHLHDLEHFSQILAIFVYAVFAVILDQVRAQCRYELTMFLNAISLALSLFIFHFHTTDHVGPEGHYHLLFQLIIFATLCTTLLGIALPKSFMVSFVRSLSTCFIGIWLIFMGFMLWTPTLVPKGCVLRKDPRTKQRVLMCSGEEALHRAKSLINLQFSWFLIGIAMFGISLFLIVVKMYGEKVKYFSCAMKEEEKEGDD